MAPVFTLSSRRSGTKYRIPLVVGYLCLAVAVIFDAIQFLLKFLWFTGILSIVAEAAGWFFSGLGIMLFAAIFALLHVNFIAGKRAATRLTYFVFTVLCEFAPLLNAVPSLTLWVWFIVRSSRVEDEANAEDKRKKEAAASAKMKKISLLRSRRIAAYAQRAWVVPPRVMSPEEEQAHLRPKRNRKQPFRNYAELEEPVDPRSIRSNPADQPFMGDTRKRT